MPSLACTTVLIPIVMILLLGRGFGALLLTFDSNKSTNHAKQESGDRQADEDGDGRARGELPFRDGHLWRVVVVRLVVVGAAGAADYDGHAAGLERGVDVRLG